MSRYVTLPHAVYGVCTPSRCVCTQFCCVRHPNVSICEPRMKRTCIGVFFILPCWPSPSSICSVALLLHHHCRQMQLRAWQLHLAEHLPITTVKLGLKPQRSRYKDEIPDLLFAEGLEKIRKSKKKKSQRSRYKDEIPVFISRLTGI